jgi:hypothetical protein
MSANRQHLPSLKRVFLLTFCVLAINTQPILAGSGGDSVKAFLKERFGFSNGECLRVDRGEIITKELTAENSFEVAVCGAMRIAVPFKLAVGSYAHMDSYRKNPNITGIGKFSTPPRIEDLNQLTLEEDDIKALKDCEAGDCPVKLPATAMAQFHKEIDWNSPDHGANVLSMVKRNFVEYVTAYNASGSNALMNYNDMQYPQTRADEYHGLIREMPNLSDWGKELYQYLDGPGTGSLPNSSIDLYWQKENFSGAKPTITINQVVICTPNPERRLALIASKQLYADHFFEASLTVTALVGGETDTSGIYLVYLNRSNYDDLRKTGIFSFTGRVRHEIFKGVERELIWTRERIEAFARNNGR